MTQTEKKYIGRVGKLYWSTRRQSYVMILSLHRRKHSNIWLYSVEYTDPATPRRNRDITAARVSDHIKHHSWIPAHEYILDK